MKISFVIRTLNEENDLGKTLHLIHNQNGDHEIEIIIVDSGSVDKTIDIAKANKCIVLEINQKEWSWGRSLNYGFEKASNEYVVVISAHCFLTSSNFINDLEDLIMQNKDVAAFYGRQLALDYYDPFEEYELLQWYPDIELKMYDCSRLIGISNACSIVKRSVWLNNKYNEVVNSLEDGIWAATVVNDKHPLMYSNKISVYHSHRFKLDYIYRKWYWRSFESQRFEEKYLSKSKRKHLVKFILFKPYLYLKTYVDTLRMYNTLSAKYKFLSLANVFYFNKIKNLAIYNAFYDYKEKNSHSSYSTLEVPSKLEYYTLKLNLFEKKMYQEKDKIMSLNDTK